MILLAGLPTRTILIETALIGIFATGTDAVQIVGALKRGDAFAALADGAAACPALMVLAALTAGAILVQAALLHALAACADAIQSFGAFKGCCAGAALADRRRGMGEQGAGQQAQAP